MPLCERTLLYAAWLSICSVLALPAIGAGDVAHTLRNMDIPEPGCHLTADRNDRSAAQLIVSLLTDASAPAVENGFAEVVLFESDPNIADAPACRVATSVVSGFNHDGANPTRTELTFNYQRSSTLNYYVTADVYQNAILNAEARLLSVNASNGLDPKQNAISVALTALSFPAPDVSTGCALTAQFTDRRRTGAQLALTIPAGEPSIEQAVGTVQLYEYDPNLADAPACLVEERLLVGQLFGEPFIQHSRGTESIYTELFFFQRSQQLSYYVVADLYQGIDDSRRVFNRVFFSDGFFQLPADANTLIVVLRSTGLIMKSGFESRGG